MNDLFPAVEDLARNIKNEQDGDHETEEKERIVCRKDIHEIPGISQKEHFDKRHGRVHYQVRICRYLGLVAVHYRVDTDWKDKDRGAHCSKPCRKGVSDRSSDSLPDLCLQFDHPHDEIDKTVDTDHVSYVIVGNEKQKKRHDYTEISLLCYESFNEIEQQGQEHVAVKPHDLERESLRIE